MYKRVSTALHSGTFKLTVSAITLIILGIAAWAKKDMLTVLVESWGSTALIALLLLLPLTYFNLYCEYRKWKALMGVKCMSTRQGLRQILGGVCSGFITPNRIGDFAGRMSYLHPTHHHKAPVAAGVGAVLQGAVTAFFGALGLLLFPVLPMETQIDPNTFFYLISAVVLIMLLLAGVNRFKVWLQKFAYHYRYFPSIGRSQLGRAVGWAIVRYGIFCSQFVIALYLFGFDEPVWFAYAGVSTLYFCQSFIPGPALGELGVREALAALLFSAFMPHPLCPILAALLIWFINIGVPVLTGIGILGLTFRHGRH